MDGDLEVPGDVAHQRLTLRVRVTFFGECREVRQLRRTQYWPTTKQTFVLRSDKMSQGRTEVRVRMNEYLRNSGSGASGGGRSSRRGLKGVG